MMNLSLITALVTVCGIYMARVHAFSPSVATSSRVSSHTLYVGYVPSGLTPKQWKKMQEEENKKKKSMNFGRVGPSTFQSRSLQSFQQDLEKGKVSHLMPMMNAKTLLKKGKIKEEDIPYMQRGGAWDNSDVRGAKKLAWSDTDKKYSQSQSAFGMNIDWTGKQARQGPSSSQPKAQTGSSGKDAPKKKLFGLF